MASEAEPNPTAGNDDDPPQTGKASASQTRYNLRPRHKPNEVPESGDEPDARERNDSSRRTGATMVFHGVDAKIGPVRDEARYESDHRRARDRQDLSDLNHRRRASSPSSDAGSRFSSAHGSPVDARKSHHLQPRASEFYDPASSRARPPRPSETERDGALRLSPPALTRMEERGAQLRDLGKHHRHRSPPIFEEMTWAELDAYRKIHLSFQRQQLAAATEGKRVHELATRPNPPLCADQRNEVDPLRAPKKSEVFGPPRSRRPGRDAGEKDASRANRRVSDR